jgi:Ca2+/Na+ antiporter
MSKILEKKIPLLFILISLSILIYTFYKSEIINEGNLKYYYDKYYTLSFVLIFFSIVTFFLTKNVNFYIFFLLILLIFFSYSYEYYLYNTGKKTLDNKIKVKSSENLNFDKRKKFEIFNDLKKNNKDISVATFPGTRIGMGNLNIFPLSGRSNSETINCNENGYYSIFKSDRYGFNNPDEEWISPKTHYVLLGDSFVMGSCVNRPNDIASVMRRLSKKSVLNLGYGGNGPLIQFATLVEYLPKNTEKVIWFYFEENDLDNLKNELTNEILRKYFLNNNFSQKLRYKQKILNEEADKLIINEIEKYKNNKILSEEFNFKKFAKLYFLRSLIFKPIPGDNFVKILNNTNILLKKKNVKLYFVYLPTYKRYKFAYDKFHLQNIKKIVLNMGIDFIDMDKEVFSKEIDPLKLFPYEMDGHYNLKGYEKVATKLIEFLE